MNTKDRSKDKNIRETVGRTLTGGNGAREGGCDDMTK